MQHRIKFEKIDSESDVLMPTMGYAHDAGIDLYASRAINLLPFQPQSIPTGIKIDWSHLVLGGMTWHARICPRSGLALKGFQVSNGVIDYGYVGEIMVIGYNLKYDPTRSVYNQPMEIRKHQKIAQLVFYCTSGIPIVKNLETGRRDTKGFGSTGT